MAEEDARELMQSCIARKEKGSSIDISYLEKNYVSQVLAPEIVSETSWDQEQSNLLLDAGEDEHWKPIPRVKVRKSMGAGPLPRSIANNELSMGPPTLAASLLLLSMAASLLPRSMAIACPLPQSTARSMATACPLRPLPQSTARSMATACPLPQSTSASLLPRSMATACPLPQSTAASPLRPSIQAQPQGESKLTADWHRDSIRHDLPLLENQLPCFVLQKIYDLATEGTAVAGSLSLIQKVDATIQELLKSYPLNITTKQIFHHLLHRCHLKFKPAMAKSSSSNSQKTDELQRKWGGATDLYKAGIKFKPKLFEPSESLLDVKFSKRTLMIPTLKIEDSTSFVFRKLIALEQSCTQENYFAAYAFFMGELMGTPEDVTLLVNQGVVENYIGANKEVSDFFNNLVKEVIFDVDGEHFLRSTFKDLNSYYNNKGHKFLASRSEAELLRQPVAGDIGGYCTVLQAAFA